MVGLIITWFCRKNHHNTHTIAIGQAIGCLLCVRSLNYVRPMSSLMYRISCYIGPCYSKTWLYIRESLLPLWNPGTVTMPFHLRRCGPEIIMQSVHHGSQHTWHNHCIFYILHIDGLVQDCSHSSALAMELLQACIKPLIYTWNYTCNNILHCRHT